MKSYPPLVVSILVGVLAMRRFGRDAVEIVVGLYLPTLLLFLFFKEKAVSFFKKWSRPV